MPRPEFLAWSTFYQLFPFDDFHRFHRPAALIASSFGSGHMKDHLEWLQPDPATAGWDEADLRTLAALGVKPPIKE